MTNDEAWRKYVPLLRERGFTGFLSGGNLLPNRDEYFWLVVTYKNGDFGRPIRSFGRDAEEAFQKLTIGEVR